VNGLIRRLPLSQDGRGAPYVAVLSNKRLCFHCIKKTGNPESANVLLHV
jgi:hypothetical protein